MVVWWVRKFPFFCSDREYIIGRRIWASGKTFYCVTKGVPRPSVPRHSKPRCDDNLARAVRNLWVRGISPSVSKELEEDFQKFGKIEGLAFSQDQTSAYIDFEKLEDAISAHRSLNGKLLGGTELCVDFQRSKGRAEWTDASNFSGRLSGPPVEKRGAGTVKNSTIRMREAQPTNVLWVGFPASYKFIDEEALRQAMPAYGVVTKTKVFLSRQYAFVEFASVAEAYNAKKNLDGHLFNDHRIQILSSA